MKIRPRLAALYYWFFKKRHNVGLLEMIRYLIKGGSAKAALRFISDIVPCGKLTEINFNCMKDKLYWPSCYGLQDLYKVCVETLDKDNWHYYESGNMRVDHNDIVVDAGASEGLFSLSVIGRCRKVFVIEPNIYFFAALNKTLSKYVPEKTELFNVAVGDKRSIVNTSNESVESAISENSGDTEMITLDELLCNKGRIDYIKADLEGYELKMLMGATGIISRYKPRMAITTYHDPNDHKVIIKFVTSLVPEYKYLLKGVTQHSGKPVMVQFWV